MKEDLILVGGGGHCISCIDVIENHNKYNVIGIIDNNRNLKEVLGYPILGDDSLLPQLVKNVKNVVITLGQIKSPALRIKIFNNLKAIGYKIPTIVSPLAYVSKHANIGEGTMIFHGARVNAGVSIGKNNIINTNALIEHDCKIGNNTHISTSVVLNGEVCVGDDSFIGSGTVVKEQVSIVKSCVVGVNSLVLKSIKTRGVYYGNPVHL